MKEFKKTINDIDFIFQGVTEGDDNVYRVSAETHHFKMTTDEDGNWGIWQQVPKWIKELEEELGNAIEAQQKHAEKNQPLQ